MSDDRQSSADGYDHTRDHAGDDVRAARNRERTTDAVDRTERDARAGDPSADRRSAADAETGAGNGSGDGNGGDGGSDGGSSGRLAFWVSALFGLALAVGAIALVSGRAPFFEDVLRIRPTVEGGGIGADWVVGNTEPILEAAITLVHLADVVMGIFILLMVFIHWAAFRRLATRMRPPAGSARARESAAATDGGERFEGPRSSSDRRSDVGEPSVARGTSGPARDETESEAESTDRSDSSSGGAADDSTAADGGDQR